MLNSKTKGIIDIALAVFILAVSGIIHVGWSFGLREILIERNIFFNDCCTAVGTVLDNSGHCSQQINKIDNLFTYGYISAFM